MHQLWCRFDDNIFLRQTVTATNGTGNLSNVGREAALFFDKSFSLENTVNHPSYVAVSNMVVASFNDSTRFSDAGSELGQSNGRVFLSLGSVNLVISNLAVNPIGGSSHSALDCLWAVQKSVGSKMYLRANQVTLDWYPADDIDIRMDASPFI